MARFNLVFRQLALTLPLVVLATGCSGSKDPRQAGILDVIRNSADGAYEKRTAERSRRNAAAEQRNESLHASSAELAAERDELQRAVRSARAMVDGLNARIEKAKAGLPASDARYAELLDAERSLRQASVKLGAAESGGGEDDLLAALERIALTEEEYNL